MPGTVYHLDVLQGADANSLGSASRAQADLSFSLVVLPEPGCWVIMLLASSVTIARPRRAQH